MSYFNFDFGRRKRGRAGKGKGGEEHGKEGQKNWREREEEGVGGKGREEKGKGGEDPVDLLPPPP